MKGDLVKVCCSVVQFILLQRTKDPLFITFANLMETQRSIDSFLTSSTSAGLYKDVFFFLKVSLGNFTLKTFLKWAKICLFLILFRSFATIQKYDLVSAGFKLRQSTQRACSLITRPPPIVDVIKRFLRKSRKSRFLLKLKQQEQAIFEVKYSFCVQFCLKIELFSHFQQVQTANQTFFIFLILGKSRFPSIKFYNIDCRAKKLFLSSQTRQLSLFYIRRLLQ